MNTTVSWYKDSRSIVLIEFPNRFTWTDFYEAKAAADTMMDTITMDCATILLAPAQVELPPNALSHGRTLFNKRHPRAVLFIITTPNRLVHSMVGMLSRISGGRGMIRVALDLDEAEAVLVETGFMMAVPQQP